MQSSRDERIRERAYHIWVAEGRIEGRQDEHWQQAEREIANEERQARPKGTAPAPSGAADPPRPAPARRARRPRAVTKSSC